MKKTITKLLSLVCALFASQTIMAQSELLIDEPFAGSLGCFTTEYSGGKDLGIWTGNGDGIKADAYDCIGTNDVVTTYAVSPEVNLGSDGVINFDYTCECFANNSKEQVFVSVRTVGGEWKDIQGIGELDDPTLKSTGDILVPAEFNGKTIQIGLKYTSKGKMSSGIWCIKHFKLYGVRGSEGGDSSKADPEISFSETEVSFPLNGGAFIEPTLNNPNNVNVFYSSSDETIATVDYQGDVTILAQGVVTITATSDETDKYMTGTASYTITVTEPLATKIIFEEKFDNGLGEFNVEGPNTDIWFKDVAFVTADAYNKFETAFENYLVSPVITLGNGSHYAHYTQSMTYFQDPTIETSFCIRTVGGEWQALKIPVYPNGDFTETGNIVIPESYQGKDVEFGFRYSASDPGNPGIWNIADFAVEMICNGTVPNVSFAVNETVGFIDREFTAPELLNPDNVDFKYSSSNPEVATVDELTGKVTLVAVGLTVITAESVETEDFVSNSICYTLNVKEASAADVLFEAYFDNGFCGFYVEGFNGEEFPIWKVKKGVARSDAYNKVGEPTTNYLVSPVITLAPTCCKVSFDYKFTPDASSVTPLNEQFGLFIREEGGEWAALEIPNVVANEMTSCEIEIPETYSEKKVQLGFMYFAEDGQKSGVLSVDNIIVKKTEITTAIEGVTAEDLNNGKIYDLQGRRVNNPAKGIYVVNGKKVVIK